MAEIDLAWLEAPATQRVLAMLDRDGEEARVNGGAVRNALIGQPVKDIDISTTAVPRDVMLRAKAENMKVVPTGIAHGTVTVIVGHTPFEVTTLRRDVESDGRHAQVLYGRDWLEDAQRRDLTMNALYMSADGTIHDPLGGRDDLERGLVRFIGDARERIEEDYLRILRFFRFFAWYGSFRPDAAGLKACAAMKDGLARLSAERVWQEVSRLLAAPDPTRALLWMRQTGVLGEVLPETVKWGIDHAAPLIEAEREQDWEPDAVLRLMSIVPPDADRMKALAERLKVATTVRDRLVAWAQTSVPDLRQDEAVFKRTLYGEDRQAMLDRLRLLVATKREEERKLSLGLLAIAETWERPRMPVRGGDLLERGMTPSPAISDTLRRLEERWIASDFQLTRDELLEDAVP